MGVYSVLLPDSKILKRVAGFKSWTSAGWTGRVRARWFGARAVRACMLLKTLPQARETSWRRGR